MAARHIRDLGGATRLLINYSHEAMYGEPDLDVPVFVHERAEVRPPGRYARRRLHTDRVLLDGDLEVIPTPGHTLGSSLRTQYLDSLALVCELDVDVLVPWGATEGDPSFALVDEAEIRIRLDAIIARVRAGSDR